jgi:hypothetical protein
MSQDSLNMESFVFQQQNQSTGQHDLSAPKGLENSLNKHAELRHNINATKLLVVL